MDESHNRQPPLVTVDYPSPLKKLFFFFLCIVCPLELVRVFNIMFVCISLAQVQLVLVCFKLIMISNTVTRSLCYSPCHVVYQNFVQFLYTNVMDQDIHVLC